MKQKNVAELITLDGNRLLAEFQVNQLTGRPVCLDVDLYKNVSDYSETALLYQIRQVLKKDFSRTLFRDILVFLDFWDFFQWKDTKRSALFDKLLREGFTAQWHDSAEVITFVPFEKSQSQAKNCVISFIRKDLFLPVRRRLDLDIGFGDYPTAAAPEGFPLKERVRQLSKLYAYRGLYLTDAIRLDGLEDLLCEDRIVVLEEIPDRASASCPMYTARQMDGSAEANGVILEKKVLPQPDRKQTVEPFDGVGLISPKAAALLNRSMDQEAFSAAGLDPENTDAQELYRHGMAVSFQFRMPFCKGMLHTVDFHRFFRQECHLEDDLWVTDAFGVQRNLKNADIILNQTLFKLWGLLRELKNDPQRKRQFIGYYFEKIRQYGHSIYIAQTDRQLHRTGYARLTAQIINTLPFQQHEFDSLVNRHTRRAMEYRLAPVLCSEGAELKDDFSEAVHKYISADYLLALDSHVESLIDSCRKQALNRLFQGKLEVEGDMRYLCRDLMYYLNLLSRRCGCSTNFSYLPKGYIYMPGAAGRQRCALFRSPHLCPNENVAAVTHGGTGLHQRYLNHLQRVVFVGGSSQMPDALGGADFDGDMAVIAFQQEVVDACYRNCYREDSVGLPLIRIPALSPKKSTAPTKHLKEDDSPYVDIQTIENTFNSQIGMISNATMKICAAETVDGDTMMYSGAFCAILNGVEIDAAKSGIRPNLSGVVNFASRPGNSVSQKAGKMMQLVGEYLKVREELKGADLSTITVKAEKGSYMIMRGKDTLVKFSADPAGKPYVYQLLCRWAAALQAGTPETQQDKKTRAVSQLQDLLKKNGIAVEKETSKGNYPRDMVLKELVFRCPKTIRSEDSHGAKSVIDAYFAAKKIVDELHDQMDPAKGRAIRNKLINVLRYKYDDIDRTLDNQLTLRQLGNAMSAQLGEKLTTAEAVTELLQNKFYCGTESGGHWLFQSEEERKDWIAELFDPQTAQIARDFGFHGYDLMFFALRELLIENTLQQLRTAVQAATGDLFRDDLLKSAAAAMKQGYSTAHITGHLLPRLCREKLEELTDTTDHDRLIPLAYACAKSNQRSIVWKMFAWPEIEAYLKKVHKDAQ